MEQHFIPEIWGGIECTINRVGDRYSDQLELTGHYGREGDIDLLAGLGISKLRYPLLWERHQPYANRPIDWSWASRQLERLRLLGVTPIAGLVHHGSGPVFTQLLSPDFAAGLADYARQAAERFPWIEYYTPVNEPLTTARFSGLYGHWYPHQHNELACMKMLLNQLRGTILSMHAIRKINPAAKLVQTEDLGMVHSSPELQYQADFENHRRWLTYDLLCGGVDKGHPLWDHLLFIGIDEAELGFFTENPCVPDIMGLNYYVTSERFLDGDLAKYPAAMHGGNARDRYVDIEAVRVKRSVGLLHLLTEAWSRYGCPMAITEAHLNCTREEQLRWLKQIWESCLVAIGQGIDIRAMTVWSMFGAFDWDSLLTVTGGHYESGAFDVSGPVPCKTAVGHFVRALSKDGRCDHSLACAPGWWNIRTGERDAIPEELWLVGNELGCGILRTCCAARGIVCRVFKGGGGEGWDIFAPGGGSPWGIVLLEPGSPQNCVLPSYCRRLAIPFQAVAVSDIQTDAQANRMLDLFIDKVFEDPGIAGEDEVSINQHKKKLSHADK